MRNAVLQLVQKQEWAITENMLDIINQVLCDRYTGNVDAEKLKQFENKFEPRIETFLAGG